MTPALGETGRSVATFVSGGWTEGHLSKPAGSASARRTDGRRSTRDSETRPCNAAPAKEGGANDGSSRPFRFMEEFVCAYLKIRSESSSNAGVRRSTATSPSRGKRKA